MEKKIGCTFCDDGIFAEMSLDLECYSEKTLPIKNVNFKLYDGNANDIREIVELVDKNWCKFFYENTPVFCGYIDEQIVSFCILNTNVDCIISRAGVKVGSIGCVMYVFAGKQQIQSYVDDTMTGYCCSRFDINNVFSHGLGEM